MIAVRCSAKVPHFLPPEKRRQQNDNRDNFILSLQKAGFGSFVVMEAKNKGTRFQRNQGLFSGRASDLLHRLTSQFGALARCQSGG